MALERVFEHPYTLKKLRSAPLGKLLEDFCCWMLDCGFSRGVIRYHLSNVSYLNEFLLETDRTPRKIVNSKDIARFFRAYPARCRNRTSRESHLRRVRYSVNRFVGYLREASLFASLPQQASYQPLLDSYLKWMRDHQNAAEGTLEVRARSIERFLRWLGPKASVPGLKRLGSEQVEAFFLAYAQRMGRAARRSMQSALRTFFRFCQHRGYIQRPLDRAVPTLRTYKLNTVPRGLTDSQAQIVLRGIDRKSDVGRRDYSIIHLLYTYGVRGGQIRSLRLEDIDWVNNRILFKASKQGKDVRMPLAPDVGKSLLDYLKNARPRSSSPQVFLTCRAPYHPLPHSNALSTIVDRHIRAAGIEVQSKGSHVFRHCFATRMLQKSHSLKAIADVLGHRFLGTTFIYTKVDFNNLEQVALEWPQEVS